MRSIYMSIELGFCGAECGVLMTVLSAIASLAVTISTFIIAGDAPAQWVIHPLSELKGDRILLRRLRHIFLRGFLLSGLIFFRIIWENSCL